MNSNQHFSLPYLIGFLFISLSSLAQSGGPYRSDLERTFTSDPIYNYQISEQDSLISWQEKVLVHVDKPIIAEGSPMFFKAYVLTGPNRVRAAMSNVLKLELMNAEQDVVATQFHKIDNGTSEGAFIVPKRLEDGIYKLRAYTRWMQNYGEAFYFTKELVLNSNNDSTNNSTTGTEDVTVSFYPEGGNLIAEFDNRLLIKTRSTTGQSIDLSGAIVDESGNVVMPTVAFGDGIMSAIFTPKRNKKYSLRTERGELFELPYVIEEGYLLNVNNLNDDALSIRVQASESTQKEIVIKGELGGITYFIQSLDLKDALVELEIPKQDIPFGVMMISLLDDNGDKLAERPVFIDTPNRLNLDIAPLNTSERGNELVFMVNVTDGNGTPVETEIAFSAVNTFGKQMVDHKGLNGFTWERYGLHNSDRTNRFVKDLELLTNSNSEEMIPQSLPNKIKYPFQKGLDLFGYAYDLNNKLLKNTNIQMLSSSDNNVVVQELQTDSSGRIRLENLQLVGDNELIFRTSGEETKSRVVKLVPIQESYDKDHKPKSVLAFEKQKNRETIQTSPWEPINSDDLVELSEVIVSDSKIERKRAMPAVYGIKASKARTAVQDVERPKSMFQLLSGIPGITVTGNLDYPSISILRNGYSNSAVMGAGGIATSSGGSTLDQPGPLWVVDGLILGNKFNFDPEWGISMMDIDRVDYIVGADASIYGSRGDKGAFMIYTRNGIDTDYINRKEGRIYFQGYYESPSFESYTEKITKRPKKYMDKATTLYWNPSIKTNSKGEAIVRFTPPIDYKGMEIKATTITIDGKIASAKTYFE